MTLDPLQDGISAVELIQHVGSDLMVVAAARVSTGATVPAEMGEREVKLLKYLLKHHHGSPFEHSLITFRVVAPVFVDRQMVKHRAGVSKNEASGRYRELTEEFYVPSKWRQQAESNRQASVDAEHVSAWWHDENEASLRRAYVTAWTAYQDLLGRGVAREQARMVLPLGLYVESFFTFNLRSLFHFLALRDHPGAQHETQLYARALAELARPLFPVSFAAWDELQKEHA